jgi:hypothetical protein
MLTVRFPNGQAVQYNAGWFVKHYDNYYTIFDKEGGSLQAVVPNDCIIEWVPACRVYNPIESHLLTAIRSEVGTEVKRQLLNSERRKKATKCP